MLIYCSQRRTDRNRQSGNPKDFMLHSIVIDDKDQSGKNPLLIAHGLFGSARNWGVLARRLADRRKVIAVDMRNHGNSPWSDGNSYADMAGDLAGVIDGQADVLGHSMGGKAAMLLALSQPDKVSRLIVADVAPVAYDHSQNLLIDAMQSVDLARVGNRRDADQMLAGAVPEDAVRAFLLQSLDLKGETPRWMLNLDVLRAEMPKIIGFPAVTARFERPALFLTGDRSDYVQNSDHARILELFPMAEFRQVENAGHWLHAENPRMFESEVRAFLES